MTDQEIFDELRMAKAIPLLRNEVAKRRVSGKKPSRTTVYESFDNPTDSPTQRLVRRVAREVFIGLRGQERIAPPSIRTTMDAEFLRDAGVLAGA